MTKLKNPPSYEEFKKFYKTKLPPNYPKDPTYFYKKQGTWKGWGDVIGKEPYRLQNPPSYEKYKKWVQKQGIKTQKEFAEFDRKKFPPGYPKNPSRLYQKQGTWRGWGDLFGTGNISTKEKSKLWLPIKEAKIEARKIAKELGIKTRDQWVKAHKDRKIPTNLPRYLHDIYNPKRMGRKK